MATVTPPPPPPSPIPQTAAQPTAVVSNPPTSLTSVAAGTRIDAIIVATMPDGRVEVESRLGRFLFQSNVALPKEGPIQLQVQTLARQLYLLITSIHGKPPNAALRNLGLNTPNPGQIGNLPSATGAAATPSLTGSQANATAATARTIATPPVQLTTGGILAATLLRPTLVSTPSTKTTPTAGRPAAGLSTVASTGSLKGAAATGAAVPGQAAGARGATSGAQAIAAYGGAKSAAKSGAAKPSGTVSIPAGNAFSVRVTSLQPPTATSGTPSFPSSTTAPLLVGQPINGVVSATSATGQTVVQTHAGPISLATSSALPAGTKISLDIMSLPKLENAPIDEAVSKRLSHAILQSRQWPALDETFGALREGSPSAALQMINAVLPRPDAALAANILLFIMGVRGGELASWMGDGPTRALQKLRPDLLNRLKEDFKTLGRVAEEPPSNEWRALPIPMASGAEIQQIQLYLRRQTADDEDDDEQSEPSTRFIVDVDFSRMGRVQLDGLVHNANKRFDLIIRTDNQIPNRIQNDIRQIFENANDITGITGQLGFQAAPPKFIDAIGDADSGKLGVVV